jgi:uncharacterized protein YdeI (YjbR/CyaY-like superfamily)
MADGMSGLSRPIQPMPEPVRRALQAAGLMDVYLERPAYQRNDYLSWNTRAKREETQNRRLAQMSDELRRGDVYMKMGWRGL